MIKIRPLTIGNWEPRLRKMDSVRYSEVTPTNTVDPFQFKEVDPVIAGLSNPPKFLQPGGKIFKNENRYNTGTSEYYVG